MAFGIQRRAAAVNQVLTISVSPSAGGTVDPTGVQTYALDTVVSVTFTATSGYALSRWDLDGADQGSANPISVTMDTNHLLVAVVVLSPSGTVSGYVSGQGAPTAPVTNPTATTTVTAGAANVSQTGNTITTSFTTS